MHVIGTAGHVDHGKSTLVAALTGIHPDRLKEEREREMTIDLGFAWFELPNGEPVGIVDVPGHRDFIDNMLAGVGGIEAVLFVIAADEGVMPQTREHLAILDILQIKTGLIVLTKIDLVPDKDWLALVQADIRQVVSSTFLAEAPLVCVSATTGEGIPELVTRLAGILHQQPHRPDFGRPRLPIDRVFTISGFGTVVTGTLSDGTFQVGDDVEILPRRVEARIRGLQTHKQKETVAVPGSRTAINLSGVEVEEIRRGDVVVHPGDYRPAELLDVRFRCLADASNPVRHNQEVKLFLGASEVLARVRLLGNELLKPGEEGWLQLELQQPVVALRGDHYILRRPSPGETLGGGIVADPQPKGRHKRFAEDVIQNLEALIRGTPAQILLQTASSMGIAALKDVIVRSGLEAGAAKQAVEALAREKELFILEDGVIAPSSDLLAIPAADWRKMAEKLQGMLNEYHGAFPLRKGISREELKSRMGLATRAFNALINSFRAKGLVHDGGAYICLSGFEIRFSHHQKGLVEKLLARFEQEPYLPPTIKECQAEVGEEVYEVLVESGELTPVSSEVVFRKQDYDRMVKEVREFLELRGTLTVAEFRDRYGTSRRYALAFLEHLDAVGTTLRIGDYRKLKA